MESNSNNLNKKAFENLEGQGKCFEEESDEFAGDDITVNKIILK